MKLNYNPLQNSLFAQTKEQAFITIVESFDKIKCEIGFNKMAYDSHIKQLVEFFILGALLLPYELTADYVKNGDEHINELTALLVNILDYRHKFH